MRDHNVVKLETIQPQFLHKSSAQLLNGEETAQYGASHILRRKTGSKEDFSANGQ
jgi:hypothetical protein